ncbi:hypothetical protein RvY_00500 [Ramazzottius varieornatus]|uniref:Uncharacterized protein n=1 Tax=Ramazzottius varieornatus TaxID=947166 RepID=A0A1D1UK94_RAMVA|nr:hypothetical protein RvY_00500 [Ramazzottius varieornatus]
MDRLTETIKADLLLDREFDENVAKRQKKFVIVDTIVLFSACVFQMEMSLRYRFLSNLKGIRCGAIRICRQMRRLQNKLDPEKCEQNSKLMECLGTKALSELVQQYRAETLSLKSQLCKSLEKYR